MWTELIITGALGAGCFCGIAYPQLAPEKGWAMGEVTISDFYIGYSALGVVISLIAGFVIDGFIGLIVVLVASFFGAFLLTSLLKSISQMIPWIGLPAAAVWLFMNF